MRDSSEPREVNRDIIVIGASAGGVEALTQLIQRLPSTLAAAIFVVLHFPSDSMSVLPAILNRCKTLPAKHPSDDEPIEFGQIYVAPPDYHLMLQLDHIHLSRGPRENGHRPAIDVLFRSAARTYRSRVVGVVLSGMLDDGTAGLARIQEKGGYTLVQDPKQALFGGMPRSAIAHVKVDAILPIAEIANQLIALNPPLTEKDAPMTTESNPADQEARLVNESKIELEQGRQPDSSPSMLTCPDCGGVLWELQDQSMLRYRCHVGHVYSMDSLVSEQANIVETALWAAIRALEEKAALARRMAKQARDCNRSLSADRYEQRATDAAVQADIVRQVITQQRNITDS